MIPKNKKTIHPEYNALPKAKEFSDDENESNIDQSIFSMLGKITEQEIFAYDIALLLDEKCKGFLECNDFDTLAQYYQGKKEEQVSFIVYFPRDKDKAISFKEFSEIFASKHTSQDLEKTRSSIFKGQLPKLKCISRLILQLRHDLANSSLLKIKGSKYAEKGKIGPLLDLLFSYLQAADYWSDVYILYQIYNYGHRPENDGLVDYTILFIVRLLAILCHYLIAYSSGIQLMINK